MDSSEQLRNPRGLIYGLLSVALGQIFVIRKAVVPFLNILLCSADQYGSIDSLNIKNFLLVIILWQNMLGQQHVALAPGLPPHYFTL